MPIWDYSCRTCGEVFESIEVASHHKAKSCIKCGSEDIVRVFGSGFQVRMDPDTILRSMPDPSPPLEELRGKTREGCEGGYADKPYADTNLNNYERRKDKYGNTEWRAKRRQYFDMKEGK